MSTHEMDDWFARVESEYVVTDSHPTDLSLAPEDDNYDYAMDTEFGISEDPADWQDELADEMAESYFDPDDMYGSFKY